MRARLLALAALGVLLGCSCTCEEEDATGPDSVLRRLLNAATVGDGEVVFELLTPEVQTKLRKLANLATAQSGGRQRYSPSDLLATTLAPRGKISSIKVLSETKQHAKVRVDATKQLAAETWSLRRIDGRWRVELPTRALSPRPAAPRTDDAKAADATTTPG
jgi:hypothetical protein